MKSFLGDMMNTTDLDTFDSSCILSQTWVSDTDQNPDNKAERLENLQKARTALRRPYSLPSQSRVNANDLESISIPIPPAASGN
jgi:hypothetical protein